ncbi:conjugal transfer protein TraA [Caballeronia humi]|uniref:Conjugal transfer protein TraA n=1 Tax=Caballeronia humi TaxID=326474 RepID=A0A158IVJ7_9BURK|nr:conjugal transfer protein TraA [Caballeronia humi]SAL60189.1 hypothetical protein AWB65_05423 [Caballeronia humi]
MNDGKSISVWYSEDERGRLEQAAALAGYRHLSKYIRDKSLDSSSHRKTARDSVQTWAEQEELGGRLAEIERAQKAAQALLAMLIFLVRKKATMGDINELVLVCENAGSPAEVLAGSLPELAAMLDRFTKDW